MEYKSGDLIVSDPWARASAGKARNGAAYITVTNTGGNADRLIKVATKAAAKTELHTVTMKDGIMMMHQIKGIEIASGEPAVLKPGGMHIMMMGLKEPLKENTTFQLTLTFETAGTLDIQVSVKSAGAMGSMGSMDKNHNQHMQHDQMKHNHKNM
jgi:hypothetical protein